MPYINKPQTFSSAINTVSFGDGGHEVTLGGANVYPLYTFDAPIINMPKIGVELSDTGYDAAIKGIADLYQGAGTVAEQASRIAAMAGCDFVCLKLDSADPNGKNASIESCVETAVAVCDAVYASGKPLAIMGCKNIEKDTQLIVKLAEALQKKNVLLLSAREEDYKTVGASAVLAYGQKIGAESAVDINLAKQLNVLVSQLGIAAGNSVMNLGSAAAGYGFEYVASTMDRVKSAALAQNDTMLQVPVITPIGSEAWSVKEALLEESEMPEWGSREERGIQMEIVTAAACLASGSDAVILRHPESVKTVSELISALK